MAWYNTVGKNAGTVISTRVRLARNLEGFPFASRLEPAAATEIIEKTSPPLEASGFRKLLLSDLSQLTATSYAERHYISPEFAGKDTPHALFIQEQTGVSVMVCEEDHLRIQALLPGFDPEAAYRNALQIEKRLDEALDFAYSDELGYLCHCPTNLGTGLRASAMMFLPALTRGGYMELLASRLSKIGLTVRGVFGEGSAAAGCMYQISNQITLGITEEETIQMLKETVRQISDKEMQARKAITGDALEHLTDRTERSLGILKHAHLMSSGELIKLFADVRLGIAMGLITDASYEQLGTLLIETMPATLTLSAESPLKGEMARDRLRAQRIRALLDPSK